MDSEKFEELKRYIAKYQLSGKECPYILNYNKKKDRVILLGVKLESVLSGDTVTIRIPEVADEISCWNFLRMSSDIYDFWDAYLNKITKIVIYGNGKALFGKLDDILCVDIMRAPYTKSVVKTPKYRLYNVEVIEMHDFDFKNIQSIRFIASLQNEYHSYKGCVNEFRLIDCKNLRRVPSYEYYDIIKVPGKRVNWGNMSVSSRDNKMIDTFLYNDGVNVDELEQSGFLNKCHPKVMVQTFACCKNIKRIPKMDYSNCVEASAVFSRSPISGNLEISNIGYVSKLISAYRTFSETPLRTVNIHDIEVDASNNIVRYKAIFYKSLVEKVTIQNIKFRNSLGFEFVHLFSEMKHLREVVIRNVDFGDADIDITFMFQDLPNLQKVIIDNVRCRSLFVEQQVYYKDKKTLSMCRNCPSLNRFEIINSSIKDEIKNPLERYRLASQLVDNAKGPKMRLVNIVKYITIKDAKYFDMMDKGE